MKLRNNFNIYN